jgi:hypothetical protein
MNTIVIKYSKNAGKFLSKNSSVLSLEDCDTLILQAMRKLLLVKDQRDKTMLMLLPCMAHSKECTESAGETLGLFSPMRQMRL